MTTRTIAVSLLVSLFHVSCVQVLQTEYRTRSEVTSALGPPCATQSLSKAEALALCPPALQDCTAEVGDAGDLFEEISYCEGRPGQVCCVDPCPRPFSFIVAGERVLYQVDGPDRTDTSHPSCSIR